jgi:3-dehydroquinate dehydratase/shikimate dehydrogenase
MHPNVDDTPVPPATFRAGMLVFDTVYHPENTMLLKLARERDCRTLTGVEMFVRQAALQFKHFTGQDAPLDVMREVVRKRLINVKED